VDNGRLAYTIKELATAAGICRDNVYDAIRADQLRAKKFGKRTLVLKVDAQAFLESLPDLKLPPKEPSKAVRRRSADHRPRSVPGAGGVRLVK
jgi:hypothetical protein